MKQLLATVLKLAIAIPLLLVLLPFMLVWMAEGFLLRVWFWAQHKRFGRDVILVTSESPTWSDYIKENILPRLENRSIVMNWSKRKLWRKEVPFAARAHKHWAGRKGYVPTVIIRRSFWKIENISLYQSFGDYKKGKISTLKHTEERLFSSLGV